MKLGAGLQYARRRTCLLMHLLLTCSSQLGSHEQTTSLRCLALRCRFFRRCTFSSTDAALRRRKCSSLLLNEAAEARAARFGTLLMNEPALRTRNSTVRGRGPFRGIPFAAAAQSLVDPMLRRLVHVCPARLAQATSRRALDDLAGCSTRPDEDIARSLEAGSEMNYRSRKTMLSRPCCPGTSLF